MIPGVTRRVGNRGRFHLNEYRTNRAFGGREEGGWWYDTGTFIGCHGRYATHCTASAARDAMEDWLAGQRRGLHPPDSPLCTGWPELRIEGRAGADFPAQRPCYE